MPSSDSILNDPDPDRTVDASQMILVTGGTGYIGGRLVPRLLAKGYRVRCLVRKRAKLESRAWSRDPKVEIVEGDLEDPESTAAALAGCGVAYYLVHSMVRAGSAYRDQDAKLARTFAESAASAGVDRIVYLGGLGETGAGLSTHLISRREVESILRETGIDVTVLRAAMIVGSGSASFEILRYLVERLPMMITPRWVSTRCQPISVADALRYLIDCLEVEETRNRTLDIGGPDVLTYRELMQITARELGMTKRIILPVPLLTPRLSSWWIHFVTPVNHRIARPLAEGLRNEVVCRNDDAERLMPGTRMTAESAISLALQKLGESEVETIWSAAGPIPGDPDWAGGKVFVDRWTVSVNATDASIFRAICRLGGGHGWYAVNWLWRIRGWLDRLVGGPGLRRGRRHPEEVSYGEALDFWRVTGIETNRSLELRAEMKLPGEALLSFDIDRDPENPNRQRLTQTARFKPRGLLGLAYWYAVLPLHGFVFRGMLTGIARTAEGKQEGSNRPFARRVPTEVSDPSL